MLCSRTRPRLITAVAVVCALGVGVTVGLGGELSPAAHVAVLTAGAVVVGIGLTRRTGAGGAAGGRRGAAWFSVLALALAWEAVALARGELPTISDLLDPVLAPSRRPGDGDAGLAGRRRLARDPAGGDGRRGHAHDGRARAGAHRLAVGGPALPRPVSGQLLGCSTKS